MICMAALPLMTMELARFQSRPEKLASTMPRSLRIWSKAFSMVFEPSAFGSSLTSASV